MFYLILSVLFTASLFVTFRLFEKYKIQTLQAIVVNYYICVLLSVLFTDKTLDFSALVSGTHWIGWAVLIGCLFITIFYTTALSTQKVGLTVTSVAAKIAMVMPVLAAIFIFKTAEHYTWFNYLGIIAALITVILCSMQDETTSQTKEGTPLWLMIALPLFVFLGSGTIDTLLSFISNTYLTSDNDRATFSTIVFAISGTIGTTILIFNVLFRKEKFEAKSLVAGVALGVPNFFSIFTLLKALESYQGNGAFVFPVANIGVIIVAALVALLFFREKLLLANKIGLAVAVMAIVLIAWS